MKDLKSILQRKSQKTSCKSCKTPCKTPQTNPTPKGNPKGNFPPNKMAQVKKKISQTPSATCPRCGSQYPIDKPILACKICSLDLGVINKEENEIEWNKRMQEPYPDFLNYPLSPDQLFQKTIKWYFEKWIKPKKGNPSYRVP